MESNILTRFQDFLVKEGFTSERHAPYYCLWVNKFLSFSNGVEESKFNSSLEEFLEHLRAQEAANWQLRQAEEAVKLYFQEFIKGDAAFILARLRKAIRLRHYAYSTERSYLDWAQKFFDYLVHIKKESVKINTLYSKQVREYLTYLAVQKQVSSSTQNQAFNAFLFLFRDVLNIELKDLDKTVRAKEGQSYQWF